MNFLLPRNWTLRARLTVLYGGLFFLAGAVLLGVTYLLVQQSLQTRTLGLGADSGQLSRLPDLLENLDGVFDGSAIERLQQEIHDSQVAFRQQTLNSLLTQGALALGLVGTVAAGLGWLTADRALRPLHQITATAQRIAGADTAQGGLHERIALTGPPDEIKKLADTFNGMIERLDRSFDSQRRLVANASHELRTPLAINRALIELAVSRPDVSEEVRTLGESLLVINARHERLIDGLLTLADSENAIADWSPVDLAEMAGHVAQLARTAADEAGLEIVVDLAEAQTTGDPVLLERLTQNLVENAVRHNRRPGWLSLSTRTRESGEVELVVANTGAVVPRYEVETIFQPFRRLSGERTSLERGFGLGLSIVAAVTRAHGGEIVAEPRADGGLTVTVVLPGHAAARRDTPRRDTQRRDTPRRDTPRKETQRRDTPGKDTPPRGEGPRGGVAKGH